MSIDDAFFLVLWLALLGLVGYLVLKYLVPKITDLAIWYIRYVQRKWSESARDSK